MGDRDGAVMRVCLKGSIECSVTDAKEVEVGNPAEETFCHRTTTFLADFVTGGYSSFVIYSSFFVAANPPPGQATKPNFPTAESRVSKKQYGAFCKACPAPV